MSHTFLCKYSHLMNAAKYSNEGYADWDTPFLRWASCYWLTSTLRKKWRREKDVFLHWHNLAYAELLARKLRE